MGVDEFAIPLYSVGRVEKKNKELRWMYHVVLRIGNQKAL